MQKAFWVSSLEQMTFTEVPEAVRKTSIDRKPLWSKWLSQLCGRSFTEGKHFSSPPVFWNPFLWTKDLLQVFPFRRTFHRTSIEKVYFVQMQFYKSSWEVFYCSKTFLKTEDLLRTFCGVKGFPRCSHVLYRQKVFQKFWGLLKALLTTETRLQVFTT